MIDLDRLREREGACLAQVSSVKMALQAHFYRQHLDRYVTCKESVGPHNRAWWWASPPSSSQQGNSVIAWICPNQMISTKSGLNLSLFYVPQLGCMFHVYTKISLTKMRCCSKTSEQWSTFEGQVCPTWRAVQDDLWLVAIHQSDPPDERRAIQISGSYQMDQNNQNHHSCGGLIRLFRVIWKTCWIIWIVLIDDKNCTATRK